MIEAIEHGYTYTPFDRLHEALEKRGGIDGWTFVGVTPGGKEGWLLIFWSRRVPAVPNLGSEG